MRFLEITYAINVIGTVAYLGLVSRDSMVYDLSTILQATDVVLCGVSLWLIMERMAAARPFVVFMNAFDIVTGAILAMMAGQDLVSMASGWVINLLIIVYVLTPRRMRAVLVRPLSLQAATESSFPTPRQPVFWRNLLLYYCIFSVVGHWMEAGFCMLIRWGIVAGSYDPGNTSLWRDWLYPFPPEGVGFAMCVLVLYPVKNWISSHVHVRFLPILLSFVFNALVCSLIELSFGLVVNAQLQLWDYSNMVGNFMGQICLQNAVGFGVASTIITWVIYPFLQRIIDRAPKDVMNIFFVVIVVFYAMLQFLYLINF
jgi:uncharacterized membrane protein